VVPSAGSCDEKEIEMWKRRYGGFKAQIQYWLLIINVKYFSSSPTVEDRDPYPNR
jgi:hypothetical protein